MHINCVICSDLFVGVDSEVVSATSCGHLFHDHCLRQWYERSLTCPQCRQKQKQKTLNRIYFSIPNYADNEEDPSALKNKIDCLNFQIKLKEMDIKNQQEDVDKFKAQNVGLKEEIKNMREELRVNQSRVYAYQDTVKELKKECKQLNEFKLEADELRKQLANLKGLEEIINGSVTDVGEILARTELDPTTLSMCVSTFKKELETSKQQKLELRELLVTSQKEANKLKSDVKKLTDEMSVLQRVNQKLKEDVTYSEEDIRRLKEKIKELQNAIMSPGASNPRDKALQRLLHEDPAPENIAHQLDRSFVVSPKRCSKKSYSPPSPGIAFRKRKEDTKYSIFQKPHRLLNNQSLEIPPKEQSSTTVYNGLGGHSKFDDFTFPRLDKFKKLTKKKNLSASAASGVKKLKPDPSNLKLDSFFS